jgi:predicted small lipoprotein YifL
MLGFAAMVRQIPIRNALVALMSAALVLALSGCGVKGPLRPAPKATPAASSPEAVAPPSTPVPSNPKP